MADALRLDACRLILGRKKTVTPKLDPFLPAEPVPGAGRERRGDKVYTRAVKIFPLSLWPLSPINNWAKGCWAKARRAQAGLGLAE